jgi:RNA polymerase sigma factor (sigma-70 family)
MAAFLRPDLNRCRAELGEDVRIGHQVSSAAAESRIPSAAAYPRVARLAMKEPLNRLLEQLENGNMAAAGELFRAFEPYLRKVIRRRLPAAFRAKFDSSDILQSVWADVLRGLRKGDWHFEDIDHLRGFLFIVTRNRLVDRIRAHGEAVLLEKPLFQADEEPLPISPQPGPGELAQADDLWRRLLLLCPPAYRPILALKSQGFSLLEIAQRTGLHPDSIRRILRTLARRLAFGR